MTDEPQNPQQIIDDATKALGQAVVKPPKKKGGKGMMIGMLLFLILTLPVAIYYGTQQITDIRSRAATTTTYRCQMPGEGLCTGSNMTIVSNALCGSSCFSGKECCKITTTVANTPTPPSGSCTPNDKKACTTDKQCPGEYVCSNSGTWSTTCFDIADNCPTQPPQPTAGPPACPNTDCNIPSNTSGAVYCTLPGETHIKTYCCPPATPLYNVDSKKCITTAPPPSCGALYEPCCGNNPGRCDTGLTCSNIDGGTCITTPPTQTTSCNRCSNTYGCQKAIWTNRGSSCEPLNPVGAIDRPVDCNCPSVSASVSGSDNSSCSGCAAATPTQPTTRTPDGTWHNCSYLNNTGSTGPVASGCDSSNCGGQSCGQFTFKCGVYCLAASCGAAACYDDTVTGNKMYYCRTDNYSCIQTTDSYTNESACATNVQLYGQKPNTGTCYTSSASCQSACQVAGSFMYVCNTSTYQCTQTSSRYTSITACEGGND